MLGDILEYGFYTLCIIVGVYLCAIHPGAPGVLTLGETYGGVSILIGVVGWFFGGRG